MTEGRNTNGAELILAHAMRLSKEFGLEAAEISWMVDPSEMQPGAAVEATVLMIKTPNKIAYVNLNRDMWSNVASNTSGLDLVNPLLTNAMQALTTLGRVKTLEDVAIMKRYKTNSGNEYSNRQQLKHTLNLYKRFPVAEMDRVTRLAKNIFTVKTAAVSFVDQIRQWSRSDQGCEFEVPKEASFCSHTIKRNALFVVEDTLHDEQFIDNPLVRWEPKIRFYAGYPVRVNRECVGSVCLMHNEPRLLNDSEIEILTDLAGIVESSVSHSLTKRSPY